MNSQERVAHRAVEEKWKRVLQYRFLKEHRTNRTNLIKMMYAEFFVRKREVEEILARRPFVPLKVRLSDESTLDIPFSHVAVPFRDSLMIFKGVKKEGSHVATGKEEVAYKRISSIEPGNGSGVRRRKKTS